MAISIAELLAAGIRFEADEAVAIAQQLIDALRNPHPGAEVVPPYGPPSAETVSLQGDGTVVCRGCGTTPAVSEIGIFLHSLLSHGSPRVPGGLRYTIARALLDVDVPPFDSLDDFSRDLARHERGARADVVRRLLRRARGERTAVIAAPFDRRRARPSTSTTELRRALRDAEARLYEQQCQLVAVPVIDQLPAAPTPARGRRTLTAVAGLAAGIALICTGELTHKRAEPIAATMPPAPLTAQSSAPQQPPVAAPGQAAVALEREPIAAHDGPSESASASASRPEVRRIGVPGPASRVALRCASVRQGRYHVLRFATPKPSGRRVPYN
jgi:hypothetical protein